MKTKLLFLSFFMLIAVVSSAQDIAVQSPSNVTKVYKDLNKAITEAEAGSIVFLPAGSMPLNDSVKINKRLTIIGVGHRFDTEGGFTMVGGSFHFLKGSDGSSLMGVYLTGDVNIADAKGEVNNFLLQFCNVNSVLVGNQYCSLILINQNYLRSLSDGGNSPIHFTNNVLFAIQNVNCGIIDNNIIRNNFNWLHSESLGNINSTSIKNNILVDPGSYIFDGSNCIISNNMIRTAWGNNPVIVTDWNAVLVKYDLGVDPLCDYHLKSTVGKNAGSDGTDIGIYGGTGFNDLALPPFPQIVFKNIPPQTDEFGNLKIQIKVKAQ